MEDKNTVYMSEKQKVKEITDKLEAGLKELFESEKYKSYLSTMSKFHNYSFNNTLLIAMQKPEATLVVGYQAWQKNFERHVNKGEKAIRILAPAPYKIKEERDKLDPLTGEMMFDEDGMPQKEEVEVTIPAFRAVSVFDVSQTDGKPIPELEVNELLSTVEGYEDFVQALKEIDGGIYDNPDVTIREALHDILEDLELQPDYNGAKGNIQREDELILVDYNELMEKAEEADRIIPVNTPSSVVADFKARTNELFHEISEMNPAEIEETIKCHVQAKIDEYDIDAIIVDVAVVGSRCRGLEQEESDLDVVVELSTNEREDDLFHVFNEDGLHIGSVKVDINLITAQRTGTLETYLPQVEDYLMGVREAREHEAAQKLSQTSGQNVQSSENVEVTLMVSECGEFHNLGEFYENIPTVEEAIAIWKQIPPERMNGIPAIGIHIHRMGEENYMDDEIDILSGKRIDLEILEHIPSIKNEPKAMEMITELIAKLPDMEIDGVVSEEMEAKVWEMRMPDLVPAEQLAVEFDRLSYDYDAVLYHDSICTMSENVSELAERIKHGDSRYLTDWLKAIISEGAVPEETERAKELLKKLADYKPLAKIEELEEQNYNMIDNVLNNGVEKLQEKVAGNIREQSSARTSLKARLAEKKAQIAEKAQDTQENSKNKQREM